MKQKWWRVVLWVAFVLMVLCAVRDIRRPAASRGAPKAEVRADRTHADGTPRDARLQDAGVSIDENDARAARE